MSAGAVAPDTAMLYFQLEAPSANRYRLPVHSVVETAPYLRDADDVGMSEEERIAVIDLIAADPQAGEIMPGCGGARRIRVARPGRGKSAGYRVITYFAGDDMPVWLLAVFAKNDKANLSKAERNELAALTKLLKPSLTMR